LVHHLLDVDPTAARILDVPSLKDLCRPYSAR
jgi:hypothetical protein